MKALNQSAGSLSRILQWISQSALRLYLSFVALTVLPVLLFSIYTDRVLTRDAEKQELAESQQVANLSSVLVEEHFRNLTVFLQSFAARKSVIDAWQRRDMKRIADQMEGARQLQFSLSFISMY